MDFDFAEIEDPALLPVSLVTDIRPLRSSTEPAAFPVGAEDLIEGRLALRYPLDPELEYRVNVTWVTADGQKSPLVRQVLRRLPASGPPLVIRWILYALRWLLQQITHPTS